MLHCICLHIDNRDESLDIEEAGGLIRSTDDLSPTCGTKEYYSVGVEKKCLDPICGSELHQSIGLETKCIKPVCNSSDHEAVGLDKECLYICNSEEHIAQGLEFSCRVPLNSNTYVFGSTIANTWMYDGDAWNRLKPLSVTREDHMCSLIQTDDGVSTYYSNR